MIAAGVVEEIRNLLRAGELSQRKIARRVGVSRGTVNAISRGKRPDYSTRRRSADEPTFLAGPPRRCPGCGGMVRMPCLACRIRAIAKKRHQRRGFHD